MEGAALLLSALLGYSWCGQPWWLLAALILVPDASMLGYLASPRAGAAIYNAAHSTIAPLLLLSGSVLLDDRATSGLALIWLAHIGFDRALGYGLKYVSGFSDTHLGRLGGKFLKGRRPVVR
jgi:hypothetical protein